MPKLKATKTSLYKLVRDLHDKPLPKMKDTEFSKVHRSRSYWLRWLSVYGKIYIAYLTTSLGKAYLEILRCSDDKFLIPERGVIWLTNEELRERGMLEEDKPKTAPKTYLLCKPCALEKQRRMPLRATGSRTEKITCDGCGRRRYGIPYQEGSCTGL